MIFFCKAGDSEVCTVTHSIYLCKARSIHLSLYVNFNKLNKITVNHVSIYENYVNKIISTKVSNYFPSEIISRFGVGGYRISIPFVLNLSQKGLYLSLIHI